MPFASMPISPLTRFDLQVFRVLFLCFCWRTLPLRSPVDVAVLSTLVHCACAMVMVLGRRGFSVEECSQIVSRGSSWRPRPPLGESRSGWATFVSRRPDCRGYDDGFWNSQALWLQTARPRRWARTTRRARLRLWRKV